MVQRIVPAVNKSATSTIHSTGMVCSLRGVQARRTYHIYTRRTKHQPGLCDTSAAECYEDTFCATTTVVYCCSCEVCGGELAKDQHGQTDAASRRRTSNCRKTQSLANATQAFQNGRTYVCTYVHKMRVCRTSSYAVISIVYTYVVLTVPVRYILS